MTFHNLNYFTRVSFYEIRENFKIWRFRNKHKVY